MSLRIVAEVYRGEDGFSVYGTDKQGRHVNIWVATRAAAGAIKRKVWRGEQTCSDDFRPAPRGMDVLYRSTVELIGYGNWHGRPASTRGAVPPEEGGVPAGTLIWLDADAHWTGRMLERRWIEPTLEHAQIGAR
jgi:hypothetical protein